MWILKSVGARNPPANRWPAGTRATVFTAIATAGRRGDGTNAVTTTTATIVEETKQQQQ